MDKRRYATDMPGGFGTVKSLCIICAKNVPGVCAEGKRNKSTRHRHNGPSIFMPSLFLCRVKGAGFLARGGCEAVLEMAEWQSEQW